MPRSTARRSELIWRHPFTQIAWLCVALLLAENNALLVRYAAQLHWNDFGKFYYGALSWRNGGSLYATTVATHMNLGSVWMQFLNLNPPHFHFVVLPFTLLSESAAGLAWLTVNAVAAMASCVSIGRELRLRIPLTRVLACICLVLAAVPTTANAVTAQCTGLLMLPMTAAWMAARRHAWVRSGAWLGVLMSVKPFLALFLVTLILIGQWRACMAAFVSGFASAMAGVAVFGWTAYVEWFRALTRVNWEWAGMNASLLAIFRRVLEPSPIFQPLAVHTKLVVPLWLCSSAAVLAASAVVARRSADHAFSVTVLASLLISPLGWVYYLWLAAPGVMALCQQRVQPAIVAGLLLLCVPLFLVPYAQPNGLATMTVACSYAFGAIALWLGICQIHQQVSAESFRRDQPGETRQT